jgi:hypothetical protein
MAFGDILDKRTEELSIQKMRPSGGLPGTLKVF